MKSNRRWYVGMKMLALFLTLVQLTGICGKALADTLKLPKSIHRIESEAFMGDTAVSWVEVPYGAESIGSRAFADSGVSRIYIPNTVTEIDEDAFDGTDAVICSGLGSYAKEWADEHEVPWEDCYNHYAGDMYDAVAGYEEDGNTFELDELDGSGEQLISTDGLTDEQLIQKINDYNQGVLATREMVSDHNQDVLDMMNSLTELSVFLSEFEVYETGGQITCDLGNYRMVYDQDLSGLFNGSEIADIDVSEDGTSLVYTTASGVKAYLSSLGNTTYLTKNPAQTGGIVSRADGWEYLNGLLNRLDSYWLPIQTGLRNLPAQITSNLSAAQTRLASIERFMKNLFITGDMLKKVEAEKAQLEKSIATLNNNLRVIRVLNGVFQALNLGEVILTGRKIVRHWQDLNDISNHAHPTVNDQSVARIRQCHELSDRIYRLRTFYIGDFTFTVAQGIVVATSLLITIGIIASAGATTIPALLGTGASWAFYGISQGASIWEAGYYNETVSLDNRLHSFVYGVVTDADTHEPIAGVTVTTATEYTKTDAAGRYRLAVDPDAQTTLSFSHDDYRKDSTPVLGLEWQEIKQDMPLVPNNCASIYGTVRDEEGNPLSGVTVRTGGCQDVTGVDGAYEIDLEEEGVYTVTAYLKGYKQGEETVSVEVLEHKLLDFELKRSLIIYTREDLENVAMAPDEDYTLGNTIDLSDAPWVPNTALAGSLDGAGYAITGMNITDGDCGNNIGLFTRLENASVTNLVIYADINVPITEWYTHIGAIAGTASGESHISGCTVFADITGSGDSGDVHIGGTVGYADSCHLRDCIVNADITLQYNQMASVGGLCGNMDGNSTAVNADTNVNINVRQNGANSMAGFYVCGTSWFQDDAAEYCDCTGTIRVETNDALARVYGCMKTRMGNSGANITVTTQSGNMEAAGLFQARGGINTGTISASAAAGGDTNATGASCISSGTHNEGNVHAETTSGAARAYGVYDDTENRLCFDCENSGKVTAAADQGYASAVGVYGCVSSVNNGAVSTSSKTGSSEAKGMDCSRYGENTANINSSGSGSGCFATGIGLNNCEACVNRGNVTAQNTSNGNSYAAGALSGRYNENRGSVEARSTGGDASANGTQCDDSQNYGNVMSRGKTAFATGCGGHSGCLNQGPVSSFANGGGVKAHGVNGAGSVSTALISATQLESVNQSNYSRLSSTDLYASDSTQCQVTINGRTALSTGSKKTGFSYNYKTGAISTWDAITNWDHWVGLCSAESVVYGYEYVWPEVPAAPVRN